MTTLHHRLCDGRDHKPGRFVGIASAAPSHRNPQGCEVYLYCDAQGGNPMVGTPLTFIAWDATISAYYADRAEGIVPRFDVGPHTGLSAVTAAEELERSHGIKAVDARRIVTGATASLAIINPTIAAPAAETSQPCGS